MKLLSGQRINLEDENKFAYVKSGKIEVYAITRNKKDFRQILLMKLEEGGAAFHSMDEFKRIDVMLYAAEDSEIEFYEIKSLTAQQMHPLMKKWFYELVQVQWIKLLADRGDDMLKRWQAGTFYTKPLESIEDLQKAFINDEKIFAMLLGVRFRSEDKKLSMRMKVRDKQKKRLIEESISTLLDEEIIYSEGEKSDYNKLEEAMFVVHQAAKALKMPTENISIQLNLTKKLDQLGLIKRLMQKGNMQMRFVSLEKDWYKKDTGVMLGYYGEKKELAAFIPTAPDKYKVVTKKNPQGIEITEDIIKNIDKDAFACYAGFPARKLKVMDLWKFMFAQCWKNDYRTIVVVSFFAGIVPLVMPIITETIFEDIIPILDREGLVTVTQVMMVTSFTTAAFAIVRTIATMRITTKLDMSVEAALWGRLLTLPEKFFRRYQSGELASRMEGMSSIKNLSQLFLILSFHSGVSS